MEEDVSCEDNAEEEATTFFSVEEAVAIMVEDTAFENDASCEDNAEEDDKTFFSAEEAVAIMVEEAD